MSSTIDGNLWILAAEFVPRQHQQSCDKSCGICYDVIMEKKLPFQRRFGILPNCSHVFCLECIRQWREQNQFDSGMSRACPICRTRSHFVCPSTYWVDTKEEKDKLIQQSLNATPCEYIKTGRTCPFHGKCFYKH